MREAIYAALQPIRSRQQLLFACRCVMAGLIISALACVSISLMRTTVVVDNSTAIIALAMLAGPVLGLIAGLSFRHNWHETAAAVDAHYGLKDRTVTALAFAQHASRTELHEIQVADALDRLGKVQPSSVVPIRVPRAWPVALVAMILATCGLFLPTAQRELQAALPPVPEHIVAVVADQKAKLAVLDKKLAETTQDLEDEKADEEKKGIKELLEKLTQKLEEINQPGIEEKEALAKLSEMQAEMQALANQLNVAALDGEMSSLGSALAASSAFEGAGKALQDGKLEKAVKELEKIDEVKLTPKEAKALEEKLKQLAKQMGDAGQGSLSDAVAELAESLKSGNGKVGQAARSLAKKINNAVKRKKANDLLTAQNEDLKEAKCQCQNNGGARIKQPSKSNDPSSTWGRTISGNIDGEKTKLASKRNELQLTGTPGAEGDSDVETTATPEARQKAAREYKEKYEKFKKESETVVDGEPIPLGHRQMVKKYFESIRPSSSDMADKPASPEKK